MGDDIRINRESILSVPCGTYTLVNVSSNDGSISIGGVTYHEGDKVKIEYTNASVVIDYFDKSKKITITNNTSD